MVATAAGRPHRRTRWSAATFNIRHFPQPTGAAADSAAALDDDS
jgi:hypothetical protein